MFFVVKGEFEVLKGTGANRERLGFIGQGGFFGENCIIEVRAHAPQACECNRTWMVWLLRVYADIFHDVHVTCCCCCCCCVCEMMEFVGGQCAVQLLSGLIASDMEQSLVLTSSCVRVCCIA